MSVIVRVKVDSKKISNHYSVDENGKPAINTEIDMKTVYTNDKEDQNYIFSSLSGGTVFKLATINKEASDQFEINGEYECVFTRVK